MEAGVVGGSLGTPVVKSTHAAGGVGDTKASTGPAPTLAVERDDPQDQYDVCRSATYAVKPLDTWARGLQRVAGGRSTQKNRTSTDQFKQQHDTRARGGDNYSRKGRSVTLRHERRRETDALQQVSRGSKS